VDTSDELVFHAKQHVGAGGMEMKTGKGYIKKRMGRPSEKDYIMANGVQIRRNGRGCSLVICMAPGRSNLLIAQDSGRISKQPCITCLCQKKASSFK
jgi:hypothetical protein